MAGVYRIRGVRAGQGCAAVAVVVGLLPIFAPAQGLAQDSEVRDQAEEALDAGDMQRDAPAAPDLESQGSAEGSSGASSGGGSVKNEAEQALESGGMQRNAPNDARVRDEAADVGQDPTLQHEPPAAQDTAPLTLPDTTGAFSGPFFLYLLLGVLAICLVIVAVHLFRTYAPARRKGTAEGVTAIAQAIPVAAEVAPPELDEIERLARAGRYADAIHLMLLRTLDLLRRRLGANWATSLTSREIVRRAELGPTDRRALKVLVGAVEISRFGGQGANEQIYLSCLDHYRLIGVDLRNAAA